MAAGKKVLLMFTFSFVLLFFFYQTSTFYAKRVRGRNLQRPMVELDTQLKNLSAPKLEKLCIVTGIVRNPSATSIREKNRLFTRVKSRRS